jgi:hypothetical protein
MATESSPSIYIELIKSLPSVVTTITAIVGVCIGARGLRKWHDETIGKRKAELAGQALVSFYEARDVFTWVRSRAIFGGEGESRKAAEFESDDVKTKRNLYFVPIERLHREKELFARFNAQRYAFAAYFGRESIKPFEAIMSIHNEILSTATVLIELTMDRLTRTQEEQDIPLRNILGWGPANRPDGADKKIDDAVNHIELLCRPILEAKPK